MDCRALEPLLVEAQSVPAATEVMCVRSLPVGWTLGKVEAFRGTSVITMDNDRAGAGVLQLTLTRHCAAGGAVRLPCRAAARAGAAVGRPAAAELAPPRILGRGMTPDCGAAGRRSRNWNAGRADTPRQGGNTSRR